MAGKTYGYARVSSRHQNLDRQLDAFDGFGLDKTRIFSDKASDRDFKRPQCEKLMRLLRKGDVLVVKSIDRLERSYEELINGWRHITKEKAVHAVVFDMPLLDTRVRPDNITGTLIVNLVLQPLSHIAQVDRVNLRWRQTEGIRAAKARDVKFGRPAVTHPSSYTRLRKLYY